MTNQTSLIKLLTWLSPAFPTGAFAYSHALEWDVAAGTITTEPTLTTHLQDTLSHGALWSDAILLRLAYRGQNPHDLAQLALSLSPTPERRLESTAQGAAFAKAALPWPVESLQNWGNSPRPHPIALALLAAAHDIDEDDTTLAYLHASISNLISAAIRLIPLGQSAGLRCQATLEPHILQTAQDSQSATLEDLGTSCWSSDISSMRHETQYTRLFRT